ncbi:MAG: hypothetical protein JNM24_18365 [Bdellovibrionaceae bacterium]|nr:hypothetical protein [Pseudobdellovibrionaceae bacterium]
MAVLAIRFIFWISLVQVLITGLAGFIWPLKWASITCGSAISLVNLWVLATAWYFIFYKKRVAPSVSVVVIKYGILILIFSQIPKVNWVDQNALVMGVLINPVALLVGGMLAKLTQKNSRGS